MVRRPYRVAILAAGGIALVIFLRLPPAARPAPPGTADARVVSGAFHVHTSRSDGMGSVADVAAAAARADLDFIILADHGDGMRGPDEPRYLDQVLVVDAVEISTTHGHYIAVGLPPSPYPLGGDGRDVVADVRRLGGFGVVAHPTSPRPELRWTESPREGVDGVEWINADSEWRDESTVTLLRAILTYPFRPAETVASLFDRPTAALAEWEARGADHPVVGVPGTDAHGGFGGADGRDPSDPPAARTLDLPDYESAFRAFSLRLRLDQPLTGEPQADARLVETALRAGRAYSVVDGLAAPGRVDFDATSGSEHSTMGGTLRLDGPVEVAVRIDSPGPVELVLIRDGVEWHRTPGPAMNHRFIADRPTTIRLEGRLAGAPGEPPVPWIVTNPIYVGGEVHLPEDGATQVQSGDGESVTLPSGGAWTIESDSSSTGEFAIQSDSSVRLRYVLGRETNPGPFVAMRVDLDPGLALDHAVRFRAWADRAGRVSVQLRSAGGGTRWRRSIYVDEIPAVHTVPLRDMRPVEPVVVAEPPGPDIDALLFVIDTVNARPGDAGTIAVAELEWLRPPPSAGQVRTPSSR